MNCTKALLTFAFSLVVILVPPASAKAESASEVATGAIWVRPVEDNVVVYTSTRTKVERIGVLNTDAVVEVVREDRGWYQIRFTRENAEFVGWVPKASVAVEGTPPDPPRRTPKPEPAPEPEKEEEEEKLSIQETHEKLLKLVEIPIGESPMWKKEYNLSRMRTYRKETGSTGMQLFGGQKAKMDVLYLFDPDEVIEVFVEDKIRELKALKKEGHRDFVRVIDSYIRALEGYIEGKFPDLRRYVQQAERLWKRIPGVVVGW